LASASEFVKAFALAQTAEGSEALRFIAAHSASRIG